LGDTTVIGLQPFFDKYYGYRYSYAIHSVIHEMFAAILDSDMLGVGEEFLEQLLIHHGFCYHM
jgi:hypothetical protein